MARYRRRILLWTCVGLVSACAPPLPEDYTQPDLDAAYAIDPSAAAQVAGLPEIGFHDPVLTDLVRAALEGNPGLAAARARLRAAAAEARAAGVRVSGNGNAAITFEDTGSNAANAGLVATLDPSQPARQLAALTRAEAASFDAEDARRLLVQEVVATYIDLRFFQQLLEFRRADAASRRRTLNDLETLRAAGETIDIDVVSARALLVEARGELPVLEADAISRRNQLAALIGRTSSDLGMDLAFAQHQPVPGGSTERGLPADLLRQRPDIRGAERRYAAALADISVARAALYPSLSLSGQIGIPLDDGADASLTPGLSIPVFNRPALRAGVDAAEARAVAAFQDWRTAVLTSVQELESALARRVAAERAVTAAEEVVALQRRALQLSRRLLTEGGDVTAFEILDRERELTSARTALAQSRRDLGLADITLRAALGLDTVAVTASES